MIAGAIALYEEALHAQAPALVMRTTDGRAHPLQVARWCGPPDAVDVNGEIFRHEKYRGG